MQTLVVQREHPQFLPLRTVSEPTLAGDGPYACYVLSVLFVVYIFNFIGRQILAILLQSIKEDFQISDTLGFLTGLAFAVFCTFAGLSLARLADRWVRRSLVTLSLWGENNGLCFEG